MAPDVHNFSLTPLTPFTRPNAAIKRPTELTYFSYDATRAFHANSISSLRYYYTPPLGVSLSEGFDNFEKMEEEGDEHLDGLLKAIEGLERDRGERVVGHAQGTEGEIDVVTWRGMMTKIMTAPYSKFDGFEMNATLFQGTIFIEESHEYKLSSRAKQGAQQSRPGMPSQDLMSYWGYKFETLSLLPDTWDATSREYIENRTKHIVSNTAQFCSVVQTGIGGTKLVIGGEIDAVWDAKPLDATTRTNWVELKTSAELPFGAPSSPQHQAFERKLLKFWAQSFLLGVPKIVVGFRSNDGKGTLLRLQEFETTGIPKMVRERGSGSWEKDVCVNCTGAWLAFLKSTITTPGVWKIKRRDHSPIIEVYKQEECGHGDILSQDFVAWRVELAGVEAEGTRLGTDGGGVIVGDGASASAGVGVGADMAGENGEMQDVGGSQI